MNEVTFRIIIFPANEELKLLVILCGINDARQLLERSRMDYWADKMLMVSWRTNGKGFCFCYQPFLKTWPHGFRNVGARRCATLLTLIFEGSSDCLHHCIFEI